MVIFIWPLSLRAQGADPNDSIALKLAGAKNKGLFDSFKNKYRARIPNRRSSSTLCVEHIVNTCPRGSALVGAPLWWGLRFGVSSAITVLAQAIEADNQSLVEQIFDMGPDANATMIYTNYLRATAFGHAFVRWQENSTRLLKRFLLKGCNLTTVVSQAARGLFWESVPLRITFFLAAIMT